MQLSTVCVCSVCVLEYNAWGRAGPALRLRGLRNSISIENMKLGETVKNTSRAVFSAKTI